MLTIFNCGQGDALRLSFPHCYWNDKYPLYIDLGPSSHALKCKEPAIDLLITHSHEDHISGTFMKHVPKIRNLYVPAYYPEYLKIVARLLKVIPRLPMSSKVHLLYDGKTFGECGHNIVLNPPLDPLLMFELKRDNFEKCNDFLSQYGTSIEDILRADDGFNINRNELPTEYSPETFVQAAISLIADRHSGDIKKAIKEFTEYDANKMSVVFSYFTKSDDVSILLTGDADKSVFNRLIKRKELRLKASILKVPHHGSKHSLNNKILKYISPKVAIVSHKNGRFGRAIDPHPNLPVVNLFSSLGIADYYTNDVIKGTAIIRKKSKGKIPRYPVKFK